MIRDSAILLLEPLLKVEGESLASFPSAIVSLLTGFCRQGRRAALLLRVKEVPTGGPILPPYGAWVYPACSKAVLVTSSGG